MNTILTISIFVAGMDFCVHNYIEDTRLAKLTSLQEKFLKHAMNAFPKAKRIIYSTCSIYPEENERVVTNVVKTSRAKWRVRDVKELLKGQWKNFGSGMYGSMGTRCMYAKPETDFTTGFFLAVLDRDDKDLAKVFRQEENTGVAKEKSNGADVNDGMDVEESSKKRKKEPKNDDEMEVEEAPKKKKKKHNKTEDLEENIEPEQPKKKDKRKLKDVCDNFTDLSVEDNLSEVPKKKKKKDKDRNEDIEIIENQDVLESSDNKTSKKKKKLKDREEQPEVITKVKKKKSKVAEVDVA